MSEHAHEPDETTERDLEPDDEQSEQVRGGLEPPNGRPGIAQPNLVPPST